MTDLRASFTGSIPEYYDNCLGPAWFDSFAQDLAQRLPKKPPGDVLELACGTGMLTRSVRSRLDPGCRLVATDISKAMLDYARAKLPGANVDWREADAAKLPFADGEFGAVVCGFGVMFVPDRSGVFREARRVLKTGGILLFNVWDRIEENAAARMNAEVIEELFPGDEEVRFRTPYEMHDAGLLGSLLAGSGFRQMRLERKRIEIDGISARNIALGQIRGTPRSLLLQKRGADLDEIVATVTAALARIGGDPYRGHAQAVVVEAVASSA